MRAANGPLNAAGMCWVTRIGGASGGIASSTTRTASVPPVEAPMAMIGLPPRLPAVCARGSTASAERRGATSSLRTVVRARGRVRAASFTLSQISCAHSPKRLARSWSGLAKKSTAPISSARRVTSAPSTVSDDTITTGIGRSRIRFSRKVMPSMRGISTSRVSTSGLSCLIFSRAISGSAAVPTTSISGSQASIVDISLRTNAESSITRTRTLVIACFSALSCRGWCETSRERGGGSSAATSGPRRRH